jgi:hypothetical protein
MPWVWLNRMVMERNLATRLTIVSCLCLITIIWKPILVFLIPGILILFLPAFKRIDLINLLAYMIGTSMSFWICSFWFLRFIPLSLTSLFLLITVIVALIGVCFLFRKARPYKISFGFRDVALVSLFVLVLGLRSLPIRYSVAPAGADMSMHTYITDLIVNADGIPESYHPILGIDEFSSFPVGFHTISALVALVGNMPSFEAAFIMTSFTYAFLTLTLFVFLQGYVSWEWAFISSVIFTSFTKVPQGFVGWGGNPTVLALAMFILFMSLLDRTKGGNKWLIVLSAVCLASVLLSHSIIFIQSFYIFGISFSIYLLLAKEYKNHRWIKYFEILVLFFVVIMPYLMGLDRGITTPETLRWIQNWVRNTDWVWHGTISDFVWTIPLYIKGYVFGKLDVFLSVLFFVTVVGVACLFAQDLKKGIQHTVFLLVCVLVILNAKYWVLPFSYAIYPERVTIMVIVPLSLFFAFASESLLDHLRDKRPFKEGILNFLPLVLLLMMMILVPKYNREQYIHLAVDQSSVTEADLEAFYWLKDHTNETDVIQNNYGDGGLWIPSIISRPITNAHINVVYLDKVKQVGEPTYVYVGKKCVYADRCELDNSDFKDNSGYELVYSEDGVYIYRIITM